MPDRALPEAVLKLEAEGWSYIWRSDRPPSHMMFIQGLPPHGPRTHHVHMAPHDHKLWERLDFRDYLIKHLKRCAEICVSETRTKAEIRT